MARNKPVRGYRLSRSPVVRGHVSKWRLPQQPRFTKRQLLISSRKSANPRSDALPFGLVKWIRARRLRSGDSIPSMLVRGRRVCVTACLSGANSENHTFKSVVFARQPHFRKCGFAKTRALQLGSSATCDKMCHYV